MSLGDLSRASLYSEQEQCARAVSMATAELVYLRHILEASNGVGMLVAKKGGEALLISPKSRERELDELLEDLRSEMEIYVRKGLSESEVRSVVDSIR